MNRLGTGSGGDRLAVSERFDDLGLGLMTINCKVHFLFRELHGLSRCIKSHVDIN